MVTENVPILKIHKLTQAQYNRELAAGSVDEKALYLTPSTDGVPVVSAASSDGVTYTAVVDSVLSLSAGQLIIFIPNRTSTSTAPTLNINDLGASTVKRRMSGLSSTTASGTSANWLYANKPQLMMYDGTYWIAVNQDKPMASDLYGSLGGNKVSYDNATSGMTATTMQAAIDELYAMIAAL